MKAIETRWKGWRFRSRTEARWAVFLEALGIEFEYEAEGYHLPSGPYLPDFLIKRVPGNHSDAVPEQMFLEIKPSEPTAEEERKALDLMRASDLPVMIAIGVPDYTLQVRLYEPICAPEFDGLMQFRTYWLGFGETSEGFLALGRPSMPPETIETEDEFIASLGHQDVQEFMRSTKHYNQQFCRVLGVAGGRRFGDVARVRASARIQKAYDAARGARFEFGQTDKRWDA